MKIVTGADRATVFNENKLVGYVEDFKLFGIDRDGYAVEICHIDHNNEIVTRFREWQTQQ